MISTIWIYDLNGGLEHAYQRKQVNKYIETFS